MRLPLNTKQRIHVEVAVLIAVSSFLLGFLWPRYRGGDGFEGRVHQPLARTLAMMQDRLDFHTTYFGVRAQKCPADHWMYQEILFETRPDIIIEIGTFYGGGALGLAHLCDLLDHGRVISVDIDQSRVAAVVRNHPRITLIESDGCEAFAQITASIAPGETVMVIEDSAHTYDNTLNVLRTYSPIVSPGCYFVVEDTICHHGVDAGPQPGPYEAVQTFLRNTPPFTVDRTREAFGITWNPSGYLRRTK